MAEPKQPSVEQMKAEMSQRGGQQPKSTVKAYKLFRVHPDHPGKLFPLFVDANTPVKMGKWVDAKSGEMRGNKVRSKIGDLAYRPGWHAGDLPIATHIGEKSDPSLTAPDTRPENHAWAEVEMPNDVDWQSEATKRGTNAQGKVVPVKAHITDQIPKGGHYRYKTNPNMTGNWLIGGSMKVNRVLSDDEVSDINSKAGLADLPRAKPFNAKKFGFAGGGNVSGALMAPDEWKAEEHVNHMAEGGNSSVGQKDALRLYHGSPETNLSQVQSKGLFGGVFGHTSRRVAESHGKHIYHSDIPTSKILTHHELNYDLPYKKVSDALIKTHPKLAHDENLHSKTWDAVIGDEGTHHLGEDDLQSMFNTSDPGEAGWEAQNMRGQVAKHLGYHAVEMQDEHGTSHLMLPGVKLHKANGGVIKMADGGNVKPVTSATKQNADSNFVNSNHKNWFNKSKVVNAKGQPLDVYHGSGEDFDAFDPSRLGENTGYGDANVGFHFSDNKADADFYATKAAERLGKERGVVRKFHLSLQNPLIVGTDETDGNAGKNTQDFLDDKNLAKDYAVANKHDGIIYLYGTNVDSGYTAIAFHPHQIKSATSNRGTYDAKNPSIHMADGGTTKTPTIEQMKLALNRQGMYSPLEKAAMAVPRSKGTAAEFMAEASKQPGYRQEEVADRKISMPPQKMTKPEFVAHLQTHASPRIQVKELLSEDDDTKYDEYQVPGNQNYREVLLKLPQRGQSELEQLAMMQYEAGMRRGDVLDLLNQKKYDAIKRKQALDDQDFRTYHWKDDPNVLAHIRLSDRLISNDQGTHNVVVSGKGESMSVVPMPNKEAAENFANVKQRNGYQVVVRPLSSKKLLHVEEIQSDWHQQGRKKGYKGNYTALPPGYEVQEVPTLTGRKEFRVNDPEGRLFSTGMSAESATRNAIGNLNGGFRVPEAPFKKSWQELALKHVLHEAAHNGYQGITITPGSEQAKRWQDEGLKTQYDKNIPAFLNKLGKSHGAEVQMYSHHAQGSPDDYASAVEQLGIAGVPMDELTSEQNQQIAAAADKKLHYFPITDSLRQQIKTEGLPQYQRGGIIHKAEGGTVATLEQMRAQLMAKKPFGLSQLQSVGANEAPNMAVKVYLPPGGREDGAMMPIGGVDMNMQPGHQLMPQAAMPPPPQQGAPGAPGQPPEAGGLPGQPPMPGGPAPGGSNILQMTPQGQAMAAMSGGRPPQMPPRPMAEGGSMSDKSTEDMQDEMEKKTPGTRLKIDAEGPGGVKGIVVPHHMLHGRSWVSAKTGQKVVVPGMNEINKFRAKVYGAENRDPMGITEVGKLHQKTLAAHFDKPHKQQLADEKEALGRLQAAKHIHSGADTLDKSEKLDTVNHEYDEKGRSFTGLASKGVAGHALYTSGHGENEKRKVLNTCPGQTAGCGGGTDSKGIVDTSKGTCFAPNAESQYVHAAVRRACHEQAKHDPAMTKDWILAHTGSLREAARKADRVNKRLLFRPNVVDETDVSSRHVIRHLNEQRKEVGKPPIVANSYGKTTELHDPENGYYVTHSNVGPKVKKGASIAENISRDQQRVRQTILGTKNKKGDDLVNAQGNVTPPKGSYMVTDVKRYSPFDKKMQGAITHAKYWSTGRAEHELSDDEKNEKEEGHFDGNGKPTTPDKAHYGHTTTTDDKGGKLRYDYQKQHILHPRLVNVPERKKNKKTGKIETVDHMIPTDSRFKDEDYLPKDRYKTKTGKVAGAILMTTPTESTDNVGHQTSFTHHVGEHHIEHALKHNGEYEIDHPKDQEASAGTEYITPQPIKIMKKMATGGSVSHGTDEEMDGHMAFPERSFGAQHRLTYRHDPEEVKEIGHLPYDAGAKNIQKIHGRSLHGKVNVHKDMDTMAYELSRKTKAK